MEIYERGLEYLSDAEFKNGINKMKVPELVFDGYRTALTKIIAERFSSMRALVVYSKSTYQTFARGISAVFTDSNGAYTEYVTDSIGEEAFNFGNEYRVIVAIGEDAYFSCIEFASKRNVPIITVITKGEIFNLIPAETLVKRNGLYSFATYNAKKTLIFDESLYRGFERESVASCVSHALSYLLGLFDLASKVKRQPLKDATEFLKYAVNGFLGLNYGSKNFYDKYIEYAVKLGVAEYISGKNHLTYLTPYWCGVAFGKQPFSLYGFLAMRKLYLLYDIYFNNDFTDYPVICDYEKNVTDISARLGIDADVLKKINKLDAKAYYSFETEFTENKKFFAEKLKKLRSLILKGEALVGSICPDVSVTDDEVVAAIRTAPYVTNEKILLKYVRDSGILEEDV